MRFRLDFAGHSRRTRRKKNILLQLLDKRGTMAYNRGIVRAYQTKQEAQRAVKCSLRFLIAKWGCFGMYKLVVIELLNFGSRLGHETRNPFKIKAFSVWGNGFNSCRPHQKKGNPKRGFFFLFYVFSAGIEGGSRFAGAKRFALRRVDNGKLDGKGRH